MCWPCGRRIGRPRATIPRASSHDWPRQPPMESRWPWSPTVPGAPRTNCTRNGNSPGLTTRAGNRPRCLPRWVKVRGGDRGPRGRESEDPTIAYLNVDPVIKELYFSVRRVKRSIMFKNPVLDFSQLLFIDQPLPQGPESIPRSDPSHGDHGGARRSAVGAGWPAPGWPSPAIGARQARQFLAA